MHQTSTVQFNIPLSHKPNHAQIQALEDVSIYRNYILYSYYERHILNFERFFYTLYQPEMDHSVAEKLRLRSLSEDG